MSYNDVYLGEKNLDEEFMKEVKRISYEICKSIIDPFIPDGFKDKKVSTHPPIESVPVLDLGNVK